MSLIQQIPIAESDKFYFKQRNPFISDTSTIVKLHIPVNPQVRSTILDAAKLALCDDRIDLDTYDLLDLVLDRPPTVDLTQPVFTYLFDLQKSLNLLVNHSFLKCDGTSYRAVNPLLIE